MLFTPTRGHHRRGCCSSLGTHGGSRQNASTSTPRVELWMSGGSSRSLEHSRRRGIHGSMISTGGHRRVGLKAGLWLSTSVVWCRGRRGKERRRVVGAGWALRQARGGVRVIFHTSGAVDAGGCAAIVLVNVPGVAAAIIIEAPPIQAVQVRGRLRSGKFLLSFGFFRCIGLFAFTL